MAERFPLETMADFFKILQQAQEMQGRLQQMQDELQHRVVNGSAGGGLVSVEADGRGQIKRIKIDPSLAGQADVEMLEDLIVVAVNDAQKKATELAQEEMGKLTGGMNLPFKLPI
jgi:DNA-binding YbaB/EbfC family protein